MNLIYLLNYIEMMKYYVIIINNITLKAMTKSSRHIPN